MLRNACGDVVVLEGTRKDVAFFGSTPIRTDLLRI